jgi:hypothetical protein
MTVSSQGDFANQNRPRFVLEGRGLKAPIATCDTSLRTALGSSLMCRKVIRVVRAIDHLLPCLQDVRRFSEGADAEEIPLLPGFLSRLPAEPAGEARRSPNRTNHPRAGSVGDGRASPAI